MGEKHILIADADPQAVEEFREALGQQWRVTNVPNSTAALAAMKAQAFDVLVASLDLPEIDGAQLLNRIRSKYPKTVRFIAATDAEKERVVKRMLGAHQILTKPFDRSTLKDTIEQALALDVWIANENVRKLVSRVRSFPTIPSLYLEVLAALKSNAATTDQIGAIIAKDMAMMTKLLQVLNSAYFGLSRRITDPAEAVGILGFENVKSMVVAVKLLGHYDKIKPIYFSIDRLWRHSTEVAQSAKQFTLEQTGDRALADAAFTAGLVHDVGKVVLAGNFDEQYHGAQSLARKQQLPLWEVEKELFGAAHGEIGAYLLGLWGMPLDLLEVAALHHLPSRCANKTFSPLTAVHVANVLAYEASADKDDLVPPQMDEGYLAELGLLERVSAWRERGKQDGHADAEVKPAESLAPTPAAPEPTLTPAPEPAPPALEGPRPLSEQPWLFRQPRWVYAGAGAALLLLLLAGLGPKLRTGNTEPTPVRAREQATAKPAADSSPAAVAATPADPGSAASSPTAAPALVTSPDPVSAPAVAAPPTSAVSLEPSEPAFPPVKLQGIFFSTNHPSAIINGKMVRLNEQLAGVRVVEIHPKSVTLEYENRRQTLTLK